MRIWAASNLRSVSLRFSAYLCVLCVYGCFNAEVRREPQREKAESKTLLNETPVVVGFGRHGFISFYPIDNQLANFFAGAIYHRRIFVHRVSATAVNTIIVC